VSEHKELLAALVTAADEAEMGMGKFRAAFARCRAAGISYDALARSLLRRRLNRAPSPIERKKETRRLRKAAQRGGVTPSPALLRRVSTDTRHSTLRCDRKRGHAMPDPKLLKRTVERTIEEFEPAAEPFGEEEIFREEPTPPSTDFGDEYENDTPEEGE
jgi:hypothetical protein